METMEAWRTGRGTLEDEELRIDTSRPIRTYFDKERDSDSNSHHRLNHVYDSDSNDEMPPSERSVTDIANEAFSPVLAFYPASVR